MTSPQREVCVVTKPMMVVYWNYRAPLDANSRRAPIHRVPHNERAGEVGITLGLMGLRVEGARQNDVFQGGAIIQYEQGCSVHLRVLPRGKSDASYANAQRELPYSTIRLAGSKTPVFVSGEADVRMHLTQRSAHPFELVRLMEPHELEQLLQTMLPYLGVDDVDIPPTIKHILQLFAAGTKRVERLRAQRRE